MKTAIASEDRYATLANAPFVHGNLDAADVAEIRDEMLFQRATQLYLWALPSLNMYGMKEASEAKFGKGYNVLPIFKDRLDARTVITTPNSDVIYALGYLDLKADGPLVIEAPPDLPPPGTSSESGNASVDPAGGSGKRRNPRGGFSVDYRNLGPEDNRSRYDDNSLTILINLDHPVLKHALKHGNIEDVSFRRLSFEIAFSEYAIAFGYEKAKQDPDMPSDDLLFEVRSTLNRVSARAASLYS
jgi:hypothetical protein